MGGSATVYCMWSLCDYVSVTSTNYELLGRGSKSYQVYVWMDDWCVGIWGRWCGMILYDYCIHLEWWWVVSVTTHVFYYECGCVILLMKDESSFGILLQYVRIVCMLYSMYVCCMCIFCYYGEYVFLFCLLSSFVPSEIWFSGGCTSSYFTFFD